MSKKNHEPGNRSNTPTNVNTGHSSPTNRDQKASTEINATNALVDDLNNTWEVDDVSSVSSEGTSNSIFSAKKVKKALGKVGSKIVGKISSSPTNTSYGALGDSFSQQKDAQDNSKTADNAKQQPNPVNESGAATPQTETSKSNNNEVKSSSEKKKDSRWRSAIDPLTGRTYYFNKDSKETVWEKPANF